MRELLVLTCGGVGACLITAAALTSIMVAALGHADDLARAVFTLACWAVGFGVAFIVTSIVGIAGGAIDTSAPRGGPDV